MIKESFKFTVRDFVVNERVKNDKAVECLPISINAIHETTSRNGITYLAENLAKGAPSFEDMHVSVDHTNSARDIIGRTTLPRMEEKSLIINTNIFNTAAYPDAIEMFEKGLWKDFSIEAVANIYEDEEGRYVAEDMEFVGIAVVDVPGVPGSRKEGFTDVVNRIIAERAPKVENNVQKLKEEKTMAEDEKKPVAPIEEPKVEEKIVVEKKTVELNLEPVLALQEKLDAQNIVINELSEKLASIEESKNVVLGGSETKLVKEKSGGITHIFRE